MYFPKSSDTTADMNCCTTSNSDQVRPVSLLMIKDGRTLVTKTEYDDDNSIDDYAMENIINQDKQPLIKTEGELGERVLNFVYSNTEDQCEAMSVMKSEEVIRSELNELLPNGYTESGTGLTKRVICIVKSKENNIELAFDRTLSSCTGESLPFVTDQMNDDYITVNAEATQLFEEIKTEPTLLDDLIKAEQYEHNIHSDGINIDPADLGNIIKTEQDDYSMDTGPFTPYDIVENDSETIVESEVVDSEIMIKTELDDSEIMIKTEIDDSEIAVKTEVDDCEIVVKTEVDDTEIVVKMEDDESSMFEYSKSVTDEMNRKECLDDYEDENLHINHNTVFQKDKHCRKRLRPKIATSVIDRPLAHKRRLMISTKMKDFVSDYVPHRSRKKRSTQRKTSNISNTVGASQNEKQKSLTSSTKMKEFDSDYVPYKSNNIKNKPCKTKNLANVVRNTNLEKNARKRKKLEDDELEGVPIKDLGIRETLNAAPGDATIKDPQKCHICFRCGKQCTDLKILELHMVTEHAGKKSYDPEHSRKKSYNIVGPIFLKRRIRKYDNEGNSLQLEKPDLPYKCSFKFCGKQFYTFAFLQSHLAQHDRRKTGKKDITCRLCGRIFQWETSLKNHLLHHTKEKPHICKICKRSFSQEGNLRRHMLSHDVHESGERKYKCDKCEKDFLYDQNLKRHMKSHGVLPHLCHVCGKGFIEKCTLDTHMRSHKSKSKKSSHKEIKDRSNPFVCMWCKKEFFDPSDSLGHFYKCDKRPCKKTTYAFSKNKNSGNLLQEKSLMPPKRNYISILPPKSGVMPMVTSVKLQSTQSNSVMKPLVPLVVNAPTGHTNAEEIRMSSKSIQQHVSNYSDTQNVSKMMSIVNSKPVLIPIMPNLIRTQPTSADKIPVTTAAVFIPTVPTSQVIYHTKRNVIPESPKMLSVRLNFCCTRCNKTFQDVNSFKDHGNYCKAKNKLESTGECSKDRMDISSGNGTMSATCSSSNSVHIDLTCDHDATSNSNLNQTPKLLSDTLTENSASNDEQTAVCQTQTIYSTNENANGIMLPACPFAAPLSP